MSTSDVVLSRTIHRQKVEMAQLILLIYFICLTGCQPAQADYSSYGDQSSSTTGPSITTPKSNNSTTTDFITFRNALNRFAFKLPSRLAAFNPASSSENIFYSPTSIVSALMLVYAGAKDDTGIRAELANLFNLPGLDLLTNFQSVIGLFRPGPVINGTVAYDLSHDVQF